LGQSLPSRKSIDSGKYESSRGPAPRISIIAGPGGRQETYRVGDPVRDGVVLEGVLPDGAVLAVGEGRQRLPLNERTATPDRTVGAVSRGTSSAVTARDPRPGYRGLFRWRGANVGPETLMRGVFAADLNGGFRLEQVKPGSVYAKSGFRAGDVVRSLNGQQIESAEQLVVLHQQLIEGGGGRGEIEVLREGRSETLRYGAS